MDQPEKTPEEPTPTPPPAPPAFVPRLSIASYGLSRDEVIDGLGLRPHLQSSGASQTLNVPGPAAARGG
jgi:hypothetical protein